MQDDIGQVKSKRPNPAQTIQHKRQDCEGTILPVDVGLALISGPVMRGENTPHIGFVKQAVALNQKVVVIDQSVAQAICKYQKGRQSHCDEGIGFPALICRHFLHRIQRAIARVQPRQSPEKCTNYEHRKCQLRIEERCKTA